MKKEEIHLWDLKRILFGQAPPEFLIEVLIRSLIIYVLSLIVMRWFGKRMSGQLSIVELAVMVMMGAIVAVPMQLPDRGLLQGVIVLLTVLLMYRGINMIAFKKSGFEKTVQGELTILVRDGVMQMKAIDKAKISRSQLFSVLRGKNIFNLSKIKRVYLEACGTYSIYLEEEQRAGLSIFPNKDEPVNAAQETENGVFVCNNCGQLHRGFNKETTCPNCNHTEWIKAVI